MSRAGTLILHPGALGDVVLALPVLGRLAERGDGPLTVAVRAGFAELLRFCPFIDDPRGEEGLGFYRLFAGGIPPAPEDPLRRLILGARRVVAFYSDAGGELRRGLLAWDAGQVDVASHIPSADYAKHAQDHLARILLEEESSDPTPAASLRIPEIRQEGRVVAIHPGSGGLAKNWPFEAFEELARGIEAAGREVLWILGPAEESWRRPATGAVFSSHSLVNLARAIGSAAAFVGNDSGPTHLAAALGVPTLALFGPSSPTVWAPRGPRVRVLWKGPERCTPCIHRGGPAACDERPCLAAIRPAEVLDTLESLLDPPSP